MVVDPVLGARGTAGRSKAAFVVIEHSPSDAPRPTPDAMRLGAGLSGRGARPVRRARKAGRPDLVIRPSTTVRATVSTPLPLAPPPESG